jgi:3-oxoacyl-(acyl-carrier-protein) synthase
MCDGVPVVTKTIAEYPRIALKNSSGFGGTNVCVALRSWENGHGKN